MHTPTRPTLTKQRLAREVGRRTWLTIKQADTACEAAIAVISEHLADGGRVELTNFLTCLSLARQVHAIHSATAVVMISSFADKEDIIEAFRAGVDDFLLKPVEAKTLVQHLGNAVIERRTKHPPDVADRFFGDLRVDPVSRLAWWKGQLLNLTKTQYTLLLQLTTKPGRWFNYAELYAACTGDHIDPAQAGHKLKMHVHNLRQRLKEVDPTSYCPIVSRRGDGLSWRVEPDAGR